MAEGDIGAVIDSLEFDATRGADPHMIKIAGGVCAIVYVEGADKGLVITVEMADDGSLPPAPIDTVEFDATYCRAPRIINISGDVYAIAYGGVDNDGFVTTVEIASDGSIGNTVLDSWEFDALEAVDVKIVKIAGGVFAIAYTGSAGDGFLATIGIASDGSISRPALDSWEFDTTECTTPDIINISGNVFAIAYSASYLHGWLFTLTIGTNGIITKSKIDTLEYAPAFSLHQKLIHIENDTFAIIAQGPGSDGYIYTVEIASDGSIGNTVLDSWEFDTSACDLPWIIPVSGNVYAVVYQGVGLDGWLFTLTIGADGIITKEKIDTLEFDDTDCVVSCILHITGNIYAIAYQGVDLDGWLKTVNIETVALGRIKYLQLLGVG